MFGLLRRNREEKTKEIYENKVSAYEFYKSLLFLFENNDASMWDIAEYGHRYKNLWDIEMFRFHFRQVIVSRDSSDRYYRITVYISIYDGKNYHRIGEFHSKNLNASDNEEKSIADDFSFYRLTSDSPFSEDELSELIKTFIDDYRKKVSIKRKKEKDMSQKEMKLSLERRKKFFNAIKNAKSNW